MLQHVEHLHCPFDLSVKICMIVLLRVLLVGAPLIEFGQFMQISSVSLPHCTQFCLLWSLVSFTAMRSAVPFYFIPLHCRSARCSAVLSLLCLATQSHVLCAYSDLPCVLVACEV